MRAALELRVPENLARQYLPAHEGTRLGAVARKIVIELGGKRFAELHEIDARVREEQGVALFVSWMVRRRYSDAELAAAPLLCVTITRVFQPAGEEVGTTYDESGACPSCRAGRRLVGALRVDARDLPGDAQLAMTIARDEWIASPQVASVIAEAGIVVPPVSDVAGGRWHQLADLPTVTVAPETTFGDDPLTCEQDVRYVCPQGDTRGLNLLSEPQVRISGEAPAIAQSDIFVGTAGGVVRPSRLLFLRPDVWFRLRDSGTSRDAAIATAHAA